MITLVLTPEQLSKLDDLLYSTTDEGPEGEGWASSGLEELRVLVSRAVEEAPDLLTPLVEMLKEAEDLLDDSHGCTSANLMDDGVYVRARAAIRQATSEVPK